MGCQEICVGREDRFEGVLVGPVRVLGWLAICDLREGCVRIAEGMGVYVPEGLANRYWLGLYSSRGIKTTLWVESL